jgi:hypothetical protein
MSSQEAVHVSPMAVTPAWGQPSTYSRRARVLSQPVQDGQTRRAQCDDDGTVERGTRSLSSLRNHSRGGA